MSIKGFSVGGVVQRYDYTALDNLPQGQGVSDDLKAALLQLARKVAYIDDQGQTYYDDLYDALYPEKTLLSITANFQQGQAVVYNTDSLDTLKQYLTVTAVYDDASTEIVPSSAYTLSGTLTTGTSVITVTYEGKTDAFNVVVTAAPMSFPVTNNLTGCTTSNSASNVAEGSTYNAVITASSDYTLVGATVSITMGGTDITTSAYSGGVITISNVNGALIISVTAVERVLTSISAVYTQSGTVYDTDSLDSLKADLVVTANYSDSSTQPVPAADYTLSGDLTHEQTIVDLLDGATWTDGIAFDDNGNQIDRPTLSCSDYLPVTPGTLYTYSKPVSGGTDAYGMGLYLYDSSKGWIGRETSAGTQSGTEYVKTYTPASNVAYVRLMAYVTAKSGAEFTYDATPSSWTSTITVAYGGKTTTFSVTVTKMPVIFTMGGKVFSGSSSDVVNTGIKLLETDRTFSLVCDFINGAVTGDMVLVHCLYEASPYYGFSFMRNNSVGTYFISGPNTQVLANTATELPSTQGGHNVVVIRHDSTDGRWKIDGTTDGTRITQKSFLPDKTVTGVDAPLVIGAKRSTAGAFSALWKGTVNSLAVYGDFLSDDSVNSILEG